jgi:hypothetical protein
MSDRESLTRRLRGLCEKDRPLWGQMTAAEMLAHLIATLRFALADPEPPRARRRGRWLRLPPVKYAFVYLMRFPKEAPTPSRFRVAPDESVEDQIVTIERLMNQVADRANSRDPLPEHPYFGRLTRHAWGVLGYKHADHHLRQFSR